MIVSEFSNRIEAIFSNQTPVSELQMKNSVAYKKKRVYIEKLRS